MFLTLARAQRHIMTQKDERLTATAEAINHIKYIKMSGLREFAMKKVFRVLTIYRSEENCSRS